MAVIWTWRYYNLYAEEVPDSTWQREFFWADQSDDCSVDSVEVDGRHIPVAEARRDPFVEQLLHQQDEAWEAERERASQTRWIELRHPGGKWAIPTAVKVEEVDERLAEFVERYGAERVRVRR